MKVVSSNSAAEVAYRKACDGAEAPFRELTANLLRIVRKRGKPNELESQLRACLAALGSFRILPGRRPSARDIQTMLEIRSRAPTLLVDLPDAMDAWRAEELVIRAGLHVAAARLSGSRRQRTAAAEGLYDGLTRYTSADALCRARWHEEMARVRAEVARHQEAAESGARDV